MILHAHDPRWADEFQRLAAVYRTQLGDLVRRVEHVGSTAIHGIAAKPILDIDLVIAAESDFPDARERLHALGYRHAGDQGIAGREVFKREDEQAPHVGAPGAWMEHHLYVCVEGSEALRRHVVFRDHLNEHPEARRAYEAIKRALESRSGGDRKVNAREKEHGGVCSAFVERVLTRAAGGDADGTFWPRVIDE